VARSAPSRNGRSETRPTADPNRPTNFFITVDGQTPTLFSPDNLPAIITTQGSVEDGIIENLYGDYLVEAAAGTGGIGSLPSKTNVKSRLLG
jgi:hypothetical protein